jgi:hypothetical protein
VKSTLKFSFRIAGFRAGIWSRDLQNTKQVNHSTTTFWDRKMFYFIHVSHGFILGWHIRTQRTPFLTVKFYVSWYRVQIWTVLLAIHYDGFRHLLQSLKSNNAFGITVWIYADRNHFHKWNTKLFTYNFVSKISWKTSAWETKNYMDIQVDADVSEKHAVSFFRGWSEKAGT